MVNHEKYEERLQFVGSLLENEFNLKAKSIEPVAYEADIPFPYNNFIYRAEFSAPISDLPPRREPGTHPIPSGTTVLIVRLANENADGLNAANRVENEVACLGLARRALGEIVPRVYGWSRPSLYGWIVMELMPGDMIADNFKDMKTEDKRFVLQQVAEMLAKFQKFELPETVKTFGGLTFNDKGDVVGGEMTLFPGKPNESYEGFCQAMLNFQLEESEKSPIVKGWEENGVRDRLRKFIGEGVGPIIERAGEQERRLVHGDFTLNNLLFDPSTNRVTALLDLDWCHVSSPADEFPRSFCDFGGRLPGLNQPDLRGAYLNGFPSPLPTSSDEAPWDNAKMWDEELERAGALRPRTIKRMESISELHWLSDQLAPFSLCHEMAIQRSRKSKPGALEKKRAEMESAIVKYLEQQGF